MAEIDYTKYRLKPEAEIKEILKEVSSILVISCKKCYKEFDVDVEPECDSLVEILGEERKKKGRWDLFHSRILPPSSLAA